MLDQIGARGPEHGGLALGVAVKPHACGVPLTRFKGWTAPPRQVRDGHSCRGFLTSGPAKPCFNAVREIEYWFLSLTGFNLERNLDHLPRGLGESFKLNQGEQGRIYGCHRFPCQRRSS